MFFTEIFGGFDDDGDDVGPAIAIVSEWDAVTRKFEWSARLGAGRDFHGDFAINGLDVDFAAESGVDHADSFFGQNDSALASEIFVRFDFDADIEVTFFGATFGRFAAFALKANRHTVVDAGGNFDFDFGASIGADFFGSAKNGFFE